MIGHRQEVHVSDNKQYFGLEALWGTLTYIYSLKDQNKVLH